MTDWRPLERELGLWQENGRVAALWLRDDDAEVPSPALDSLLEKLGETTETPAKDDRPKGAPGPRQDKPPAGQGKGPGDELQGAPA